MDLRQFVTDNQPEWERLRGYLARVRQRGLSSLEPAQLRELGILHRKISADLAVARSAFPGSKVERLLNDLALRSHNTVYRVPRRKLWRTVRELWRTIPQAVRRHGGALYASSLIFFTGAFLGAFGTLVDESVATMVLGRSWVESIQDGEYWVERFFGVLPRSVASAGILTNNLSVAIAMFGLGCLGLPTAFMLFQNGVMIGAVITLCARYELLSRFIPFVVTHGVIEISAILLAGAGAFVFFDGLLHPGDRTRMAGFRAGAREGLLVAAAAAPALLLAGPVEGLISPTERIPGELRITLGVCLGLALWTWLLRPVGAPGTGPPDAGGAAAGSGDGQQATTGPAA